MNQNRYLREENPCVKAWGQDPEGRTCLRCDLLVLSRNALGGTGDSDWCAKRKRESFHSRHWPACAKIVPKKEGTRRCKCGKIAEIRKIGSHHYWWCKCGEVVRILTM